MNIRAQVYGGVQPEPLIKSKKPKGSKPDSLDSVVVPRESHRASNDRGEDRHRLAGERARISHNGRELVVELINLSGGGAMIAGKFSPMLWDRVDLHLGNHGTIECAVRWVRDGRVGLEFAHETRLDWPSDEVATVLRTIIERTFPHIEFPESGVPAPVELDDDDNRRAPRHPLFWKGTLHHNYQSDPVRIRNISATGAMIETSATVVVGSEPLLELTDAVSVSATVEWAVGDQVGLRFHAPFDISVLGDSRPSVVPNEWCPPDYLRADAPQDDRWQRLSLQQLREELEGFLKR